MFDLILTAQAATEAAHEVAQVAEVAHEATASGGVAAVIAGTFGLNAKLFLAQLFNFGLLVLILWRILYKPLVSHMESRAQRIAEGLENAKHYDEKLAKLEVERLAVLAQADGEARQKLAHADQEVMRILSDGRGKAEAYIGEVRARAAAEISQAKDDMLTEVRRESADLVVLAAEKVLRQRLDDKADKHLVEEALQEAKL